MTDAATLRRLAQNCRQQAGQLHAQAREYEEEARKLSGQPMTGHAPNCGWHCDQYDFECDCGFIPICPDCGKPNCDTNH